MNYVYILLLDDKPVYAGLTSNPIERYRRHYLVDDCCTHKILKYYYYHYRKVVEMKLVFCSPDRQVAEQAESNTIYYLRQAGFNIINWGFGNFQKLTEPFKVPGMVIAKERLKYLLNYQTQILKEYGYSK